MNLPSPTTLVPLVLVAHVPTVVVTITDPITWNAPAIVTLELVSRAGAHSLNWKEKRLACLLGRTFKSGLCHGGAYSHIHHSCQAFELILHLFLQCCGKTQEWLIAQQCKVEYGCQWAAYHNWETRGKNNAKDKIYGHHYCDDAQYTTSTLSLNNKKTHLTVVIIIIIITIIIISSPYRYSKFYIYMSFSVEVRITYSCTQMRAGAPRSTTWHSLSAKCPSQYVKNPIVLQGSDKDQSVCQTSANQTVSLLDASQRRPPHHQRAAMVSLAPRRPCASHSLINTRRMVLASLLGLGARRVGT